MTRVLGRPFEGSNALPVLPFFAVFHTAEVSAVLMRFRPSSTLSANLIASGSVERFSVVHLQKDAISAALSIENLDDARPDSMIGIRAAAALRRLISLVEGGIGLAMA